MARPKTAEKWISATQHDSVLPTAGIEQIKPPIRAPWTSTRCSKPSGQIGYDNSALMCFLIPTLRITLISPNAFDTLFTFARFSLPAHILPNPLFVNDWSVHSQLPLRVNNWLIHTLDRIGPLLTSSHITMVLTRLLFKALLYVLTL